MSVDVTAFYHFTPLAPEAQLALKGELETLGSARGLRGLCLIGPEGVNLTASGPVAELKDVLVRRLSLAAPSFKDSRAPRHPFRSLSVKLKKEIVTIGSPDRTPGAEKNNHLRPREWHELLDSPDVVVLDTRNEYEVEIGRFKNAIDLKTNEFRDFPRALAAAEIPKHKKVLIYCTGGIRCEKAILEMNAQGYEDVHQLDGGILNYLAEYPDEKFTGECFVFDYRVAVDQRLRPTARYALCPHCGQPADFSLACAQCAREAIVCAKCAPVEPTCSKNCAHHRAIGSRSRRTHAQEMAKRKA